VDDPLTTLTAGFFETSLPGHPDRPIALLHVDGDPYQSYLATLENLFPNGGIVVFDDFAVGEDPHESFPGARQALKDFLRDDYRNLKPSIGGTYYYVKP
jgi:predicted O-methyltransferase YrrM